jgi:hypothetical protein
MAIVLSDEEIMQLIQESKTLPKDWRKIFRMKDKRGHKEQEMVIPRDNGSQFRIIVRQNLRNALDFSLILGYLAPRASRVFNLRRYNGKSHRHTNSIERTKFYDFHIHTATERYQEAGFDEEGYAEVSNEYSDVFSAVNVFIRDCNMVLPEGEQPQFL